jgi:Flp pilus assembly secretin CpaC
MNSEPAVVAGSVSRSEIRSLSGLPGLGFIPILNKAFTKNSKQLEDDELLVVITPRVVSNEAKNSDYEVWMGK